MFGKVADSHGFGYHAGRSLTVFPNMGASRVLHRSFPFEFRDY
jgi:hypothetical protein